ncbi:hypothetical protein [Sphingomonas sp.]|uniref:hypothetical protein n=1 Tax=Sphingomonas sp. TaxID=28214 RepID=UPI001D1B5821|nr:hypothetical protein [Sphingomonas sp.]MBX9796926.1 hypothetical protein [Sphingomonas sp.]
MAGAAAVVARARHKVISFFMTQNAVSADRAVAFVSNRLVERRMLDRFVEAKVLVPVGDDRFYLDVPAWDAYAKTRRRRVGLFMGALAAAGAAAVALLA